MVYQAARVSGLGNRLMRFTPVLLAAATSLLACGRQYNTTAVNGKSWDDVAVEVCAKVGAGQGKATPAGLDLAKKQLIALNDNAQAPGASVLYPNGLEVICTAAASGPACPTVTAPSVAEIKGYEVEAGKTETIDISSMNIPVGNAGSVAANIKTDPKINAELIVNGGKVTAIKVSPKLSAKADEVYTLYLMNGSIEIAFVNIKIKGRSGGNGGYGGSGGSVGAGGSVGTGGTTGTGGTVGTGGTGERPFKL